MTDSKSRERDGLSSTQVPWKDAEPYRGTIDRYREADGKHRISYDEGTIEWLALGETAYDIVGWVEVEASDSESESDEEEEDESEEVPALGRKRAAADPLAPAAKRRSGAVTGSSQYVGVRGNGNRWVARIRVGGQHKNLGTFETELEAAQAYAAALEDAKRAEPASKYRGVNRERKSLRRPWTAKIGVNGKYNCLGSFATEEAAARAYDDASEAAGRGRINFP